MTLKNNRAPLLCYFKLCALFHSHPSIQTGVTVRKRQIWLKIGDLLSRVTLKFDGWPWPFAWISLLSLVITLENFLKIRSWEHSEKGVTGGRTDGNKCSYRTAWSQLKMQNFSFKKMQSSDNFRPCWLWFNVEKALFWLLSGVRCSRFWKNVANDLKTLVIHELIHVFWPNDAILRHRPNYLGSVSLKVWGYPNHKYRECFFLWDSLIQSRWRI